MSLVGRNVFFATALITSLWAPVNLLVKFSMNEISQSAIAAIRWVGVTLILWFLLAKPKFRAKTKVTMPSLAGALLAFVAGFLCVGPANTLFYYGLERTTSIEGTVLNTSGPVWASLLAIFFLNEKVSFQRWAAILVAFIGSYIIAIGFTLPTFSEGSNSGNLIYLLGVFLESAGMVLTTKVVLRSSGIGATSCLVIGIAVWSVLVPFAFPHTFPFHYQDFGPTSLICLAYLIVIAGIVCFISWYKIAEKAPISLMVICLGLEPIIGAVLGNRLLQEPLTYELFVGTTFVLASLIIATKDKASAPTPATTATAEVTNDQSDQNEHRGDHYEQPRIELAGVLQENR